MLRSALIVASAVILSGCSSLSEPKGYDLPDRDESLDPSALAAPRLVYACGGLVGTPITGDEKVFVDVVFLLDKQGDRDDHVYPSHIATVQKYGGTVVYEFHFPVARVWIAPSNISALAKSGRVNAIYAVNDLRRYDWFVGVQYKPSYSYVDGAKRYSAVGGRVDNEYTFINAIGGLLPDWSAIVLRQDPGVEHVENMGFVPCYDL